MYSASASTTTAARLGGVSTPRHDVYTLHEFLDDQHCLLKALRRDPGIADPIHRSLDDVRLVPVVVEELQRTDVERKIVRHFRGKYGPSVGRVRRTRFVLVLRFVEAHADEITQTGFGTSGTPPEVHEDLLRLLLGFPVAADTNAIPPCALPRFFDDWGQHWF